MLFLPTCTCSTKKEKKSVGRLLTATPSYSVLNEYEWNIFVIHGQILLIDPLPNLKQLYSLILQKKRLRNVVAIGQPNIETMP